MRYRIKQDTDEKWVIVHPFDADSAVDKTLLE